MPDIKLHTAIHAGAGFGIFRAFPSLSRKFPHVCLLTARKGCGTLQLLSPLRDRSYTTGGSGANHMKYSGRWMRLNADRLGAPEWVRPFLRARG